jgi:transcriptional regulator
MGLAKGASAMRGKPWLPSHTAEMAVLKGRGWTDEQIAKRLGFTRKAVQERRALLGVDNCYSFRRQTFQLTSKVTSSAYA